MNQEWIELEVSTFFRRQISYRINQYPRRCDRFDLNKVEIGRERALQAIKTAKLWNIT